MVQQQQLQQQQQQIVLERPGMPPVVLSAVDCMNIIRQQKDQIDQLVSKIAALENELLRKPMSTILHG